MKAAKITAAVMFTDVVHSSKLWNLYPAEMFKALRFLDTFIFATCIKNGGKVIKTIGDSTMLLFDDLPSAIEVGKKIQAKLLSKTHALYVKHIRLRIRIGISYGEVYRYRMKVGDNHSHYYLPDVFGRVVNFSVSS